MARIDTRPHVSQEATLRRYHGASDVHLLMSRSVRGDEAFCGARFLGVAHARNGAAANCRRCLSHAALYGRSGC